MKYLIVCLLAIAVFQTPSDAFLSSIISGLTNVVGSVVNTVNNGIDSITSTINTVTMVGQFLWDNALSPSLTVLQQNGADFIDNYFGNVLNLLGKRDSELEASTLNVKESIKSVYLTETTALIQSIKTMVIEFGKEAAQLLRASTLAIVSGQTTIKSVLSELIQKYKVQVDALVQNALQVILNGISMTRLTGLEELAAQVGNTVLAIGNLTTASINALLSTIVAGITGK